MTVHLETSSSTTATRKGAADSWSKVSTQEMVGRGLGPLTEERKPQHASPADPSELGGQWSDWRREKQCGAGVSARFGCDLPLDIMLFTQFVHKITEEKAREEIWSSVNYLVFISLIYRKNQQVRQSIV